MTQTQTPITCSSCGTRFNATVYSLVDVEKEPQAKSLLLSGRLNTAVCPQCGTTNVIAAPILYHDPERELLAAFVPMELNLTKDQQEQVIGDLLRGLPSDNFKGYMFAPKRTLTMQGLVEMVLEADGVTHEMLEEQRARVRLAEQFLQSEEVDVEKLVAEHDAQIDVGFFQTMTMMAQRAIEDGRPDIARAVVTVQNRIAELSTAGQELLREQQAQEEAISEVAAALDELGEEAGRSDLLDLAVQYIESDAHLQALVGMARPAFDYTFFQEMTGAIGQAPSAERPALEALRDKLTELTRMVDEQAQFTVQQATGLLQAMINSEDPAALVRANAPMIDETFMAVLSANMEEANRRQDAQMAGRLRLVSDAVMSVLQEGMQPEMRFINALLQAESQEAASAMLAEGAEEFGPTLLESLQSLEEVLAEQGDTPVYRRIQALREEAARIFS